MEKKQTMENIAGDKWTIYLVTNDGYFDFFQNWLHFYRNVNLSFRMIIIAEDNIVYQRLKQIYLNYITVVKCWSNISNVVKFSSKHYKKLMLNRVFKILKYIGERMDLLLTDVDHVWLKNPMLFCTGYFDICMSHRGGSTGILSAGLIAIRSNDLTINHFCKVEMAMR